MKVSVSLPREDVEFLDEYARAIGAASRSAVVQQAIRALRASQLGPAYAQAWKEWEGAGDADLWDSVAGDGLEPGTEG